MNHTQGVSRIPALTGIRILAAALVFGSHLASGNLFAGPIPILSSGYSGVTLFFCLSGFVLTWNYSHKFEKFNLGQVCSFGVARFSRVYPTYLLALVCILLPMWFSNQKIGSDVWLHVFGLQAWSPDIFGAYGFNSVGWSVSVEFFLYACFPVLMFLFLKNQKKSFLLTLLLVLFSCGILIATWANWTGLDALALSDPGSPHRFLYRSPVGRLGDFVAGMLVALMVRNTLLNPKFGLLAQWLGSITFIAYLATADLYYTSWSWDIAYLIPSCVLIWGLAAAPATGFARFLSTPFVLLAGEASFVFYLFHKQLISALSFGVSTDVPTFLLISAVQFFAILGFSIVLHSFFEKPMQRGLRKVLQPATR